MPRLATLLALTSLATLSACAAPSYKRNPVPENLVREARLAGYASDIRAWGDEDVPEEDYAELVETFRKFDLDAHDISWLVISGGGQNGAFGAGLLTGWTERGDRPTFHAVTGVSTGALIAPFAFLGSEYDHILEEAYTTYTTSDLIKKRGLLTALTSDAAATTKGLEEMINRYVTEDVVEAIAHEWREHRRSLLIATTNMDAMRPVKWSISRIAASDRPDRVALIRRILLASASIPAAFPPVYFQVEAGGRTYDEMHVDGGATSQLFAYPLAMDMRSFLGEIGVIQSPDLFLIRNAFLDADWKVVEPRLPAIAGRAIQSLIRTQGIGDIFQVYAATIRDDLDFHLAYIPETFEESPTEDFDPVYMRALFDFGREMGRSEDPWTRHPPNFDPESLRQRR